MAVFGSLFAPGGKMKPYSVTTYKPPPETGTSEATRQSVFGAIQAASRGDEAARAEAKSANEQRYQQLLGIANQDYARSAGIREQMLGVAGQTTGQRAADIRSGGAAEEANILQRLRKLGMSGTTVAPTLRAGVRKETESSLNRLADTMQQTRLGIMREQAGATQATKLGIMERRSDPYPDTNRLSNLTQLIGTGQGGDLIPSILGGMGLGGTSAGSAPVGSNSSLTASQYKSKYG